MKVAETLRARLAAAGLEPPADVGERGLMERELAVHLERVGALARVAVLGPGDPPYTDPTRAVRPG
ncbi:MAG TPA: hypothetical protein VFA46_03930 [Actinomycetes bacterium]|jgi:hypothetical protein|nr:hypothetical protein [Actinomycetes bacterium]